MRRASLRSAYRGTIIAAVAAYVSVACSSPAWAEPEHSDPFLAVGVSSENSMTSGNVDMVTYALGWRFFFGAGQRIDGWLSDTAWSAALVVEPYFGVITGDLDSFEVSVVPMIRLERNRGGSVWPFFEGGIGLTYTDVRGLGLGSPWNFNDAVGGGLSFATDSGRIWDVGYRYRHISHAGLFSDQNSGMNTHFLTFTVRGLLD